MKAILVPASLVLASLALVGCGSGKKADAVTHPTTRSSKGSVTASITVIGATPTMISDVKTGTRVRCRGWSGPSLKVPPLGKKAEVLATRQEITVGETATGPSSSLNFQLRHLQNGSIWAFCETTSG